MDGTRSSEPGQDEDPRQGQSVVDGTSEMVLRDGDNPRDTVLDWSCDVTVAGIASLAARLMAPVTQKLTDSFFDQVRKRIER